MAKPRANRVVLGTLKLPEKDAQKFREALQAYGERAPGFLRRCAYALITHHKNNDLLYLPLAFQLGRKARETPNE